MIDWAEKVSQSRNNGDILVLTILSPHQMPANRYGRRSQAPDSRSDGYDSAEDPAEEMVRSHPKQSSDITDDSPRGGPLTDTRIGTLHSKTTSRYETTRSTTG